MVDRRGYWRVSRAVRSLHVRLESVGGSATAMSASTHRQLEDTLRLSNDRLRALLDLEFLPWETSPEEVVKTSERSLRAQFPGTTGLAQYGT